MLYTPCSWLDLEVSLPNSDTNPTTSKLTLSFAQSGSLQVATQNMLGVHRMFANFASGSRVLESVQDGNSNEVVSETTDQLTGLGPPGTSTDGLATSIVPPWMRDIAPAGARHSRASSLVSTHTKFSTTTLDDARSIDIHVGGQYFRIARDGSRITDDAPPPYSDPTAASTPLHQLPMSPSRTTSGPSYSDRRSAGPPARGSMGYRGGRTRGTGSYDRYFGDNDDEDDDETEEGTATPRSSSPILRQPSRLGANILDPSEVDMPSPVDDMSSEIPGRELSYKKGQENLTIAPEARKLRTVSHSDRVTPSSRARGVPSPLKRRNGVRLPTLITDSFDERLRAGSSVPNAVPSRSGEHPTVTRSAGPILITSHDGEVPQSPTFIGRNAQAVFPVPPPKDYKQKGRDVGTLPEIVSTASKSNILGIGDELPSPNQTQPLAMDSENDISLHYAGIMRTLDRNHRKALHLKDKELEKLRERLNEVDTVYRLQLKARDFIIDDVKKRLEALQENTEIIVEKARNQVEDLWESRWKDRDFHLRERMRRIEEDAQRKVDGIRAHYESKSAAQDDRSGDGNL